MFAGSAWISGAAARAVHEDDRVEFAVARGLLVRREDPVVLGEERRRARVVGGGPRHEERLEEPIILRGAFERRLDTGMLAPGDHGVDRAEPGRERAYRLVQRLLRVTRPARIDGLLLELLLALLED